LTAPVRSQAVPEEGEIQNTGIDLMLALNIDPTS
jgi:hypothetical protein